MLYVPPDFKNGYAKDALVNSGAHKNANAQNELDRIKEHAPNNVLGIDDFPQFQKEIAIGQLEKPIATATLEFDIGHHLFAEHFDLMKKLTGLFKSLHLTRQNNVVNVTTLCLGHLPHLTMHVKSAVSETSSTPQVNFNHDTPTNHQWQRK